MTNRQWVLESYPTGAAVETTWKMIDGPRPKPGPGQILIRTRWLSVDPYMRGRISPSANYTKGVQIGEVMQGGGVGEVVATNHPAWSVGDIAESMDVGWQEWSVLTPDLPGASRVNKVDSTLAPPQASLSWLGMTGLTAYVGLLEIGRPRPGDTVVVSAASGAVGQLVGQIAKLAGCRVVGIAGSDDKLAWCRSIGFDATINYKTASDMTAAIAATCPDGVNVFFDNTGGPIHDAVLKNLAVAARVVICGRIALANSFDQEDTGLRASSRLIVTRATIQGLVVFDWWHRREEAFGRLAAWHRSGAIQTREDILEGFERMPQAFLRMMAGQNFGKQLVRL
jgi:NADPH-dependent curcumin reductase CurA